MTALPLDPGRIEAAARAIDPVFTGSPQFHAEALDEALGCELVVKVETVNPIRSFKGRGTDWFVKCLDGSGPLVCSSAGNFGQGLAYAGTRAGRQVVVFASRHASPIKIERMRALGAEVRQEGEDLEQANDAARAFAQAQGALFVQDGREPTISEGAGTIGHELVAGFPGLDAVLIPLGGGALAIGVATWFRHASPATRRIAVVASGAPAMALSWRERRPVETGTVRTIADGVAIRVPVPEAVEALQDLLDDVVLVDDLIILAAMRLAHQRLGLVVEPAGAIGLAAVLADREHWRGQHVATVLCGGNLTAAQIAAWLTTGG
jgi:threonine dehydratase